MAKAQRDKGKRGEREVADLFIDTMRKVEDALWLPDDKRHSEAVKRNTLQSDRGGFDLVGIPLLACEIKRCETLALNTWWQQTVEQAAKIGGGMPVLFYRQSRQPWRVRTHVSLCYPGYPAAQWVLADMLATDFMAWYGELYKGYCCA